MYFSLSLAQLFVEISGIFLAVLSEAWGSSILLLFETLPWLGPTHDFFPVPESPPDGEGETRTIMTPLDSHFNATLLPQLSREFKLKEGRGGGDKHHRSTDKVVSVVFMN